MNIPIQKMVALLLAALLLLTACDAPMRNIRDLSAAQAPAAGTSADTAYAQEPTSAPPPATPTSVPPPAVPNPTPVLSPTMTSDIIDISAQQAALLPDFVGDLNRADTWDRYIMTATLLLDTLTVAGDMQAELVNQSDVPMQQIYFRLYPNHPDFGGGSLSVGADVRVNGQPVAVAYEQDGVLLRLDLPQPVAPGEWAVVNLSFAATTPRNASGSGYGAFNSEANVWAMASFYPVLARRFGSNWDLREVERQGDLAVTETGLYDVTIDTPPSLTLVTTGVQVEQMALDHGPRRERFVSGPQRDFLLLALQGLDQASVEVDGTRVVSYYQRGDAAAGQRSLAVAEQSLRAFNARFGRYPLAELEVVQAALTYFIGVEYPGLVLIEQRLYRPGGRLLDTTVAHEVAHQWWYSLVGNDVQGEPWLDEGLTSYSQVLYYEGLGDQVNAERELQAFRDTYARVRGSALDGPIGGSVGSFQGNYVALVYAKGALFFHALRTTIGEAAFAQFLQSYYGTYRYEEASGPDMLRIAEESCACELDALYDAWVNGSGPVELP